MAKFGAVSSSGSRAILNFLISSPFYPNLTPSGERTKLEFNAGYIFDYNDFTTLAEPIEVEMPEGETEFFLEKTGSKTFYVEIEVYATSGKIRAAKFKEGEIPDTQGTGPYKLPYSTDRSSDNGVGFDPVFKGQRDKITKIRIILAKFKGEILEELYLRENLHLNLLSLRVYGLAGAQEEAGEGQTFPLVIEDTEIEEGNEDNPSPDSFSLQNGALSLIGIASDQNIDRNDLSIRFDYQTKILYLGLDGDQYEPKNQD